MKWRWTLLWLCTVLTAVASGQYVPNRYIVELSGPAAAEGAAKQNAARMEIAGRRASIRAAQQALRTRIEQTQATVLDSVQTVANALIVHATPDKINQIASLPGVVRVHKVRQFKPLLDAAIPLHQVDRAWSQIGPDKAGAGVKIAIIDSGIDNAHPGFQDPTLPVLAGFPLVNDPSDVSFTNNKVIVARSYAALFDNFEPDPSAQDRVGHGTALAMAAAGVTNAAPLATITGAAPKAYLGSYKIFGTPGFNDSASEDSVLKALDDAVADGMDIINLSFGGAPAPRLQDDIEVQALQRVVAMGIVVTASAGNDGPDRFTLSSPATSPDVIAVGASHNARVFSTTAVVGGSTYIAVAGDAPVSVQSLTAPMVDVATLDGQGLACSPLAAGSLTGRIALILRGSCFFETKLNNAAGAGAVGALVYTTAGQPDPIQMSVGLATLPAQMVSNADGVAIRQLLQSAGDNTVQATLQFTLQNVPVDANRVASFSSVGPNVDGSIKPDLLAAGTDIYTATQSFDPWGAMYDPSGYIYVNGTSFSAPLTAGAAAILKAARPGFTAVQYRSMLVNTASPLGTNDPLIVQQSGAGLLNVFAALNTTAVVSPTTLSFGVAGRNPNLRQTLSITNLGANDETFTATIAPRAGNSAAPAAASPSVAVAAGETAPLDVQFSTDGLAPGAYEGYLTLTGAASGTTLRIPYWYAIPSAPASLTIFQAPGVARAGSTIQDAIDFRVTDAAGAPLTDITPDVSISGGDGSVQGVTLREDFAPGMFSVDLRLASSRRTVNTVHIQVGDLGADVAILGR